MDTLHMECLHIDSNVRIVCFDRQVTLFERDDRDQYRKTRAFSVVDHPYDIR